MNKSDSKSILLRYITRKYEIWKSDRAYSSSISRERLRFFSDKGPRLPMAFEGYVYFESLRLKTILDDLLPLIAKQQNFSHGFDLEYWLKCKPIETQIYHINLLEISSNEKSFFAKACIDHEFFRSGKLSAEYCESAIEIEATQR